VWKIYDLVLSLTGPMEHSYLSLWLSRILEQFLLLLEIVEFFIYFLWWLTGSA
jgi:hypothetical protein